MKIAAIILAVLAAGLAFGLYQSNSTASHDAGTAATAHAALSNQVAELRTKLALEQGTATQAATNFQSLLLRRTSELLFVSNRLVQANLLLAAAQHEARTAQTDAQGKAANLAVAETQRDEFGRRCERIAPLEKQHTDDRKAHEQLTGERDALLREIGRLQVEKADGLRRLEDEKFLRAQLVRVQEDAALSHRVARSAPNAPTDRRARLELQPDGTVKAAAVRKP